MKKMTVIRITLWWGMIADLLETIRLIVPQVFIKTVGLNTGVSNELRFALLYGAPVMLGWTLILFWVNKKPIARKGVFLCLIPVILSYIIVQIIGLNLGVIPIEQIIPTFVFQGILLTLSILSYSFAKDIAQGMEQ